MRKVYPTLYGASSTGKIKEYSISVQQQGDSAFIEKVHGYRNGKKQVDVREITVGKNIGKSNETTPFQQACKEAESSYSLKKDKGYVESITMIHSSSSGNFLPMLAHRFDKHSSKISYPAWTQAKLDGSRCLARKKNGVVTLWSRTGKVTTIPNKIIEELEGLLQEGECVDGEIYVHGWTFQRLISATKKRGPDTDLLEYHIYDSPAKNKTFEERFIEAFPRSRETSRVKIVPTIEVKDLDNLNEQEQLALSSGYEGLMVRNRNSPYKYKNRSFDLQKVKRFKDDEFEIVGGREAVGRESGTVIFTCVTTAGLEFSVRPKGTQEERKAMFRNLSSYIGKYLTVQYFELTDENKPRFPVGVAVRDYE